MVCLLLLFYWVFVHVYDSTVVKSLSEDARRIAFPFYGQLLGRWRFLTYINLVSIRMFSAIKVVICVYNILGLFCTLAWHQAQWALSAITSQHKMAQRVGVLCTKSYNIVVGAPLQYYELLFVQWLLKGVVFHHENVYVLQRGARWGLHINFKIDVRSYVPISKCRSAFAWWDYSTQDFALPICAFYCW